MARFQLSMTLAACALLGASCLHDYGQTPFVCVETKACPEGYQCLDGVCRREGAQPPPVDARGDWPPKPPDGGGQPDAGRPDLWKTLDHFRGKEAIATLTDLPAGKTCKQIDDCYKTCKQNDQPCYNACFNSGSPDGKAKMAALVNCEDQAAATSCSYPCNFQSEQACLNCLKGACPSQYAACFP